MPYPRPSARFALLVAGLAFLSVSALVASGTAGAAARELAVNLNQEDDAAAPEDEPRTINFAALHAGLE